MSDLILDRKTHGYTSGGAERLSPKHFQQSEICRPVWNGAGFRGPG